MIALASKMRIDNGFANYFFQKSKGKNWHAINVFFSVEFVLLVFIWVLILILPYCLPSHCLLPFRLLDLLFVLPVLFIAILKDKLS
jgi:hypothetical protein